MQTSSRVFPRRLWALALALIVLGTLMVAQRARAQNVTLADIAAAESLADGAEQHLSEERALLADAEHTRDRLEATLDRLALQQGSTADAASSQSLALRSRIARMYMIAQRGNTVVVGDVGDFSARVAYLAAISADDRDSLSRLAFSAADLATLVQSAERQLRSEAERIEALQIRVATAEERFNTARQRLSEVRSAWEAQEAARRAAEEEETRRQEAALAAQLAASSTTTTTAPAGSSTTTTAPPSYGYDPSRGAEQWRSLVTEVFARWGLDREKCATRSGINYCVPGQVDNAMKIMACESNGVPFAENPRSGAAGLFQHLPYYWSYRVDRVRAYHPEARLPANASVWNPEHNITVAALLVWESRETILGNRSGGGVSPAVWPEFNWDRYESSGYGYSVWGKGPGPWGHWTCGSKTGVFSYSWVHPWATQQSAP